MESEHGFIRQRLVTRQIDRLLVIAINARTSDEIRLRQTSQAGLGRALIDLADGRVTNYSYESIEVARRAVLKVGADFGVKACFIELGFESIGEEGPRERLFKIPTSFSLRRNDVREVITAGRTVVRQAANTLSEFTNGRADGVECGRSIR